LNPSCTISVFRVLVTDEERRRIVERARGCCEYCLSPALFATQSFSLEHIVPRSKGGRTSLENLAYSCQGCNNHKYNRIESPDPVSGLAVALFHPRLRRWSDHFAWNEDYTIVIGVSPEGRATVEALRLNRPGLVNLRRVLYAVAEHPPFRAD